MASESNDGLATLWQGQPVTRIEISLDQLRWKARRFESRIHWRNLREYAAGALVVGVFGYYVWRIPAPLVRLGSMLVIVGGLFALRSLHVRGASGSAPVNMAFSSCLEFHRRQLERQRDLLRDVWTWYLLPFVPGLAVFLVGLLGWTLAQPNAPAHRQLIVGAFVATALGCGLVLAAVGRLNRWAARKLQREIDALAALEEKS
jgi:hypothetical protein